MLLPSLSLQVGFSWRRQVETCYISPPTWGQEPPCTSESLPWQTCPHDLVLTELALLGLGQGLPAPGPLTEGEMETVKKVLSTPRVVPAGAE